MKQCIVCSQEKKDDDFYRARRACRACLQERERQRSKKKKFCPNCHECTTLAFRMERKKLSADRHEIAELLASTKTTALLSRN
jgi:hypothetical protein